MKTSTAAELKLLSELLQTNLYTNRINGRYYQIVSVTIAVENTVGVVYTYWGGEKDDVKYYSTFDEFSKTMVIDNSPKEDD